MHPQIVDNFAATGFSTSLNKTGSGTWVLTRNSNNNFTGGLTISNGTLIQGASNVLGGNAAAGLAAVVVVNSPGVLSLNGFTTTIGQLTGNGIVQNANATPATLIFYDPDNNYLSSFNGTLRDGPGGGRLSITVSPSAPLYT